jgi:hypothetical protein
MTADELFRLIFRLTEQVALLTAGLKNVESSLSKVEEYEQKIAENSEDAKQAVKGEMLEMRSTVMDLTHGIMVVKEAIEKMPDSLQRVMEDCTKDKPCLVCAEKDKTILELQKVGKALTRNQRILFTVMLVAVVLALIGWGLKTEVLKDIVGIFFHG